MTSFGRVTEVYVDSLMFDSTDLTIVFDVPFDDDAEPNVAEIKMYNLSNDTINQIKKDSRIILNAGYKGDVGAILLGVAKSVRTDWSGVDKVTTIQVLDGSDSWFSMPLQKTYAAGMTGEDILVDLTTMTGLQIGAFSLPSNHVYKSGKTIKGKLKDSIVAVSKDCGAKAHVTRGKVFIRPKDEGDTIGFVLDSDHGLVSSPTPVEKEKDGKKRTGWAVKCLLNHKITTDALIQISSRTANGIFRVESGKHNGGNYETEMEVYPV